MVWGTMTNCGPSSGSSCTTALSVAATSVRHALHIWKSRTAATGWSTGRSSAPTASGSTMTAPGIAWASRRAAVVLPAPKAPLIQTMRLHSACRSDAPLAVLVMPCSSPIDPTLELRAEGKRPTALRASVFPVEQWYWKDPRRDWTEGLAIGPLACHFTVNLHKCRFLRVLSAAYRADLQPSKSLSPNDSRYLAGILRTYRAMSRYTRVRDCENLETRTPAATNPKAVHKERWGALALPHRITL